MKIAGMNEGMNEYKSRIQEYFLHKAGLGLILSPRNWMTIEQWERMGIPLHIVIYGIDKTFENLSSGGFRGKTIRSLLYCQPEILNLWKEYQKKKPKSEACQIDGDRSRERLQKQKRIREYIGNRIFELISQLTAGSQGSSLRQEFDEAIRSIRLEEHLRQLHQEVQRSLRINVELIEKKLQNLDEQLLNSLLSRLNPHLVEDLRLTAEKNVQGYRDQMQREAYRETIQAHFIELLRKEYGTRRLSLYR